MTRYATVLLLVVSVSAAHAQTPGTPTPPVVSDPFASTPAVQQDASAAIFPSGTWGLGFVQTISGLRGPEIEYYLGNILISASLGISIFSPKGGDTATLLGFGGGAFYPLFGTSEVALMVGGRLALTHVDFGGASGLNFALEAPARVQWYLNDHLSVHFEVGVAFKAIGDGGDPAAGVVTGAMGVVVPARGKGSEIVLGGANLLGSAGATVYF